MTNSQTTPRFGTWKAAQSPFVIEYDHEVLRRIQREVNSGFRKLPHGGLEVGGLLLGTVTGNLIRIDGFEPLNCEHALGPSFTLSEQDQAEVARRLNELADDSAPVAQRVLGWYHSHTRTGLALTADDLAVHYRHFPEDYQVALLLRPLEDGSARAGFFLREPGGSVIRASTSYLEFELPTDNPPSQLVVHPGGSSAHAARHAAEPLRIDAWREAPPQFNVPPDSRGPANMRWGVWAALACMLGLSLSALLYMRTHLAPPRVTAGANVQSLRVEAVQRDGNILVSWDPKSLGGAKRGVLEVQDGAWRSQLALNESTLTTGNVTYANKSDVTDFHLRVERPNGTPLEGSFTFVAPAAAAARRPAVTPPIASVIPPVVSPNPAVGPTPDQQTAQIPPGDAAAESQPQLEIADRAKAAETQPARVFQPPVSRAAVPQQSPAIVDAPPPTLRASAQPGVIPQAASQVPRIAPPPPPKPQPVAPPPTTSAALPRVPPAVKLAMPIAGKWVLKPGSVSRSPGVPESVTIFVQEANGVVQGSLDASYRTAGGASEHTSFSFSGKSGSRFPWNGPNGQHGHIEFMPVPDSADTVEVVWYSSDSKQSFDHIVRKAR